MRSRYATLYKVKWSKLDPCLRSTPSNVLCHYMLSIYYNGQFISEFDDKASALMFALDQQQIDQALQSKLKSA